VADSHKLPGPPLSPLRWSRVDGHEIRFNGGRAPAEVAQTDRDETRHPNKRLERCLAALENVALDVRSSGRIFEKLVCHTASRHIPCQQVSGAQHRPLENEHRPSSGIQVCRPTLATEVKGMKKTPITINRAPAIFNNEVFFICFSPLFRHKLLRY